MAKAGIPVGVSVSPMIPFINEPELEHVLERAREAGATSAFATVLRLPWEVNPLFQQWLATHFPERAARVMARVGCTIDPERRVFSLTRAEKSLLAIGRALEVQAKLLVDFS